MVRFEKNIEIIHDLLQIQLERALTYERMWLYGNHDDQITALLKKISNVSRNCLLELRTHISDTSGSDPADRVEIKGEILHEWQGLKLFLADCNYEEKISCFEVNEVRTTIAYQKALKCGDILCSEVRSLLKKQLEKINILYTQILESREKPFIPEVLPTHDERKPPAFFDSRLHTEI